MAVFGKIGYYMYDIQKNRLTFLHSEVLVYSSLESTIRLLFDFIRLYYCDNGAQSCFSDMVFGSVVHCMPLESKFITYYKAAITL